MAQKTAANLFTLEIREAKALPVSEKKGTADPYCKIKTSFGKHKYKTRALIHTVSPTWSDTFVVPVSDPKGQITISVWDKQSFRDDKMCSVTFDVATYAQGKHDVWIPLEVEPARKRGESKSAIRLIMEMQHDGAYVSPPTSPTPTSSTSTTPSATSPSIASPSLASSQSAKKVPPHLQPISDKYEVGKELGRGGFSVVYQGESRATQEHVAIKDIDKNKLTPADFVLLQREVEIMTKLDHKHIVKLIDKIDSREHLFLILEIVPGGELFDRVRLKGNYTEVDAAEVVTQILDGVAYMHEQGVVHRDLKPENLLIKDGPDGKEAIKIADFGLSKDTSEDVMTTACGTPSYVAPEVLVAAHKGSYDPRCDIWSVGVITYVLLSGCMPFGARTQQELFQKILRADYHYNSPEWAPVSQEAKEFIDHLLQLKPENRPTAADALKHHWLSEYAPRQASSGKLVSLNSVRFNLDNLKAVLPSEEEVAPK
eukprot:TRINITY_DN1077_c0_g1_i1.p1 TRINITY_DN1077_c0_g1~~TRINITY_DN1077_c0_g1_i1.p1  ORF type:complete len:484 (+),score=137.89 TRINITY_DN1077_c0_g1_i1:145-1596(+)